MTKNEYFEKLKEIENELFELISHGYDEKKDTSCESEGDAWYILYNIARNQSVIK